MARIVRYVLVALVAFAIGLVSFLPARIAAGWIGDATPITLGGVTGTLFSGHAAYANGPGGALENLNWSLRPAALLLGGISADLDVDSDLGGFSGTVTRSLFGNTRIENLSGDASAGWLAKLGGYTFLPLSGDVRIAIDEAAFDDNLTFSALAGRVQLANTRWQLVNPSLPLGRFNTALDHGDDGIRLAIVDSDGPLAIDGQIEVTQDRSYRLDVRLRARAGADDRLDDLLDQVGDADDQGWHRVQEQGRL